jgi:hypothetical protein
MFSSTSFSTASFNTTSWRFELVEPPAAAPAGGGYDYRSRRRRRYALEHDGRVLYFDTEQEMLEASAALDRIEELRQRAAAAGSPKARRRIRSYARRVEVPPPSRELDLALLEALAGYESAVADLMRAREAREYERLLQIVEQLEDEEEVEMLLLAH